MSTSDVLGRYAITARLALSDHLAMYPPRIVATTVLPRVVLQAAFLSMLGRFAAGEEGLAFAFVGARRRTSWCCRRWCGGPDVLVDEKTMGTMYRLRLSRMPVAAILLCRWWVTVVEGVLAATVCVLGVGLLLGLGSLAAGLVPLLPLYALTACSTAGMGLFAAAVSAGRRVDVLVTNVLNYAMLLCCGVVAPLGALGVAGAVGQFLPLTNGLLAIRAALESDPWLVLAARELATGIAWGALGAVVLAWQGRRARKRGHDDFF